MDDAYEVYWNGALVGSFGRLPPDPVAYSNPPPHTFGLGPARSGVLAIRVWKAPPESFATGAEGGLTAPPRIGSPASIAGQKGIYDYTWLRNRQVSFGMTLLYTLVTVLGFIIWLKDRSQRVILWLALFALTPVCMTLLLTPRMPLPYRWALGLAQPFVALIDISSWFLLLYLFQLDKNPRLRRWTYIFSCVEMTVQIFEGMLSVSQYSFPRFSLVADATLTEIYAAYAVWVRAGRLHIDPPEAAGLFAVDGRRLRAAD